MLQCLSTEPSARPSAQQLVERLAEVLHGSRRPTAPASPTQ